MRTDVTRFEGTGNAWIGEGSRRFRGWQLICVKCGATSRIISAHKTNSLPPEIIFKKLSKLGWNVGSNVSKDKCPECKNALPVLKKQIEHKPKSEKAAAVKPPPPPVAIQEIKLGDLFFEQMRYLLMTALDRPQHAEAYTAAAIRGIDLAIENCPKKLKAATRRRKPKQDTEPSQPVNDSEYQAWLDAEDRAHKDGNA